MKVTLCNAAGGTTDIKRFNYVFHHDGRPVEVDLSEQKLDDLMKNGLVREYVAPKPKPTRQPEIQNEREPVMDDTPQVNTPTPVFRVGTPTPDWG